MVLPKRLWGVCSQALIGKEIMNSTEQSAVSRDDVIAAYKEFLGRRPESEEVILHHIGAHRHVRELFSTFLNAVEFQEKAGSASHAHLLDTIHRSVNAIEVDVSPEVFARLFERVTAQWTALGQSEPFWSVLSHDRFRMDAIEETKREFYASGESFAQQIDICCKRTGVERPSGTCFELGCGVGRVTRYLANRFDRVIGADISEGNLNLARDYLRGEGAANASLLLLRDIAQLESLGGFDFFYSVIVLQHNPPPIIAKLLRTIFKSLRSGGGFLFQVPTHRPNYEFSARAYLESPDPAGSGFEMHAIPMHVVLDIIQAAGGQIKEVLPDLSGGYGSHLFFGVKP